MERISLQLNNIFFSKWSGKLKRRTPEALFQIDKIKVQGTGDGWIVPVFMAKGTELRVTSRVSLVVANQRTK